MPSRHGFTVTVNDVDGRPLTEYGNQSNTRSKVISTKIRAIDGQLFHIKVEPQGPFPSAEDDKCRRPVQSTKTRRSDISRIPGRYNVRSSETQRHATDPEHRQAASDMECDAAAELDEPTQTRPRYDFVAWVYIDGKPNADNGALLPLDPSSEDYSPHGYTLEGRYSALRDVRDESSNNMELQPWRFTSKGIDVLLSRLDLAAADPTIPKNAIEQELDEVTKALANDKLADDSLSAPIRCKPGQIEVKISRVVYAGLTDIGPGWERDDGEGEDEGEDHDNTHTVEVDKNGTRGERMCALKWNRYREDEDFFAKFVFLYMGLEKLVNLGLCTPDGKPIELGRSKGCGTRLAILSRSPGQQRSLLKRHKSFGPNDTTVSESQMAKAVLSSDEEDSTSEGTSSSDYDVLRPRPCPRKRRGAIDFRKRNQLQKRGVDVDDKVLAWNGGNDANLTLDDPVPGPKLLTGASGLSRRRSTTNDKDGGEHEETPVKVLEAGDDQSDKAEKNESAMAKGDQGAAKEGAEQEEL